MFAEYTRTYKQPYIEREREIDRTFFFSFLLFLLTFSFSSSSSSLSSFSSLYIFRVRYSPPLFALNFPILFSFQTLFFSAPSKNQPLEAAKQRISLPPVPLVVRTDFPARIATPRPPFSSPLSSTLLSRSIRSTVTPATRAPVYLSNLLSHMARAENCFSPYFFFSILIIKSREVNIYSIITDDVIKQISDQVIR